MTFLLFHVNLFIVVFYFTIWVDGLFGCWQEGPAPFHRLPPPPRVAVFLTASRASWPLAISCIRHQRSGGLQRKHNPPTPKWALGPNGREFFGALWWSAKNEPKKWPEKKINNNNHTHPSPPGELAVINWAKTHYLTTNYLPTHYLTSVSRKKVLKFGWLETHTKTQTYTRTRTRT